MLKAVLSYALTRASAPEGVGFAAQTLPSLVRAVPRTRKGAELVRSWRADPRWAARYVAARAVARIPRELMSVDEAWEHLLCLAGDEVHAVREGAAFGFGSLAAGDPQAAHRLELLLSDREAPLAQRRAATRSLVVLVSAPETTVLGERLLRRVALQGSQAARGVGAVLLGRAVGARNPQRARDIAGSWLRSDQPQLRRHAVRALRALGESPTIQPAQ